MQVGLSTTAARCGAELIVPGLARISYRRSGWGVSIFRICYSYSTGQARILTSTFAPQKCRFRSFNRQIKAGVPDPSVRTDFGASGTARKD